MSREITVTSLFNTYALDSAVTTPVNSLQVVQEGIVGSKYFGLRRLSDSRDRELLAAPHLPKGIEVKNWRQWSAVETKELEKIADKLGVPYLDPSLLGANIGFIGLANFSELPKGTLLHFPQDAILLVEAQNIPCVGPGKEIQKVYNQVNPSHFVKAAMGLRGLVGTVYHPGIINVTDVAYVQLYEPKFYSLPTNK